MIQKVQFWKLIINIICKDHKNAKIIKKFQLEEDALTFKIQDFTTVGSLYFWLTLLDDLCWGQFEGGDKIFWINLIK